MMQPLTLLRSTAPHAGLAAMSDELRAAVDALPRAQQIALIFRDVFAGTPDSELEGRVALELCHRRSVQVAGLSEARELARAALKETRGILHPDGKVTR